MANEAKLVRDRNAKPDFPSNSETVPAKRPTDDIKERMRPIVKGRLRKKGLGAKIRDSLVSSDNPSIMDYILFDILVPAAKETISNIVSGGVEMLLFGEKRHRPNNVRRDGTKSYVSYSSYYDGSDGRPRNEPRQAQDRHAFDDVIFGSRGEAEEVLSKMSENVEEYGLVSVADFYDLCNLPSNFTDNRYGWTTNIKDAFTERTRDGYIIKLPRTKPIT